MHPTPSNTNYCRVNAHSVPEQFRCGLIAWTPLGRDVMISRLFSQGSVHPPTPEWNPVKCNGLLPVLSTIQRDNYATGNALVSLRT